MRPTKQTRPNTTDEWAKLMGKSPTMGCFAIIGMFIAGMLLRTLQFTVYAVSLAIALYAGLTVLWYADVEQVMTRFTPFWRD